MRSRRSAAERVPRYDVMLMGGFKRILILAAAGARFLGSPGLAAMTPTLPPIKGGWTPAFRRADAHDLAAIQNFLTRPEAANLRRDMPLLSHFEKLDPKSEADLETAGPLVDAIIHGYGLESEARFQAAYRRAADVVGHRMGDRTVELLHYIGLQTMDSASLAAELAALVRARDRYQLYDQFGDVGTPIQMSMGHISIEQTRRNAGGLGEVPPYWQISLAEPAQLAPLIAPLAEYRQAQIDLKTHLASIQPLIADVSRANLDAPFPRRTGLMIVDGSLELMGRMPGRVAASARHLFDCIQAAPELAAIAKATSLRYWRRKFSLQWAATDKFNAVVKIERSLFRSWADVFPDDENYLERAEQEFTVGPAADDHFFKIVLSARLIDYAAVDEQTMLDLLAASGKINMNHLRRAIQSIVNPDDRRLMILHAAMPLIYHSSEMPRSVRIKFRLFVASYVYGFAWNVTPYRYDNANEWADVPGAQFARAMGQVVGG